MQLSLGSIAVTCVTQTRHTSPATANIAHEDFKTEIFSLKSHTLRINRFQIYEGVSINHSPSAEGYLMNSKAEYQQGEVARVVLVRGLAQ